MCESLVSHCFLRFAVIGMYCNCDLLPMDSCREVVCVCTSVADIMPCLFHDVVVIVFVNNAVVSVVHAPTPLLNVMVIKCHLVNVFFRACRVSILLH